MGNNSKMIHVCCQTNLEELRLRIPEIELDLVDSRLVLQRVGCQVLNSVGHKVDTDEVLSTNLRMLKLDARAVKRVFKDNKCDAHLLMPMFLILPLSTNSSSFCQVG